MKTVRKIPKPTKELLEQCNAQDQFGNFDQALRAILAVPKSEMLKCEARLKRKKARRKAR
jgi:hypothetical protein